MDLQLIDFHAKFMEDYLKWASENPEIANDEDRMEDDLFYSMYDKWLQTPKSWIDGMSPNGYFEAIADPQMLVSAMIAYIVEEVPLPDPLIEQILLRKDDVYPILLGILSDADLQDVEETQEEVKQIKAICIELITQMQLPHPYKLYMQLLLAEEEDSLLAETAAQALSEADAAFLDDLLEAYARADDYARKAFVDILAGFVHEERVYNILVSELLEEDADVAFVAASLGRFGDERAIPLLKEMSDMPDIDAYTFDTLRNAIEQISGESIAQREFEEDELLAYIKTEGGEDEA